MSNLHPSILHVLDTAAVSCTLAKWTNKVYGVKTNVYAMKKHDPFGHVTCGKIYEGIGTRLLYHVIQDAKNFDIVHLHQLDQPIHKIRKHYPEKPIVMHYHGTDIRGRWNIKKRYWAQATAILVSTRNLLEGAPEETTYLPNPIDTDLFHPTSHEAPVKSALTFKHGAIDIAEELAKRYDLELCIHNRNKTYLEMPQFLRQFSWYLDVKRSNAGVLLCRSEGSGSKTGLEALACGLKVVNSDGEIREGLPSQHRAENVVKALHPIYKKLVV